jgi:hypothetical protein
VSGAIIHGLAVYAERDVLGRSVTVFTAPFPRIRHVPRVRMSFSITDAAIEDAAIDVGTIVSNRVRSALDTWPALAARYLKRAARRVRMARKKRRGW